MHALPQVARGAATVLLSGERLDCEEAWRLVERHRVTNMFTVPTILTMLTRHDAVDRYDHASLRYVIYAGAPMYRADQVHALRKLGNVLVQYFGMGEVTGNITVLPRELHSLDDAEMPVGSCGFPRTGMEVAILDLDGNPSAAGTTGEICVRGPGVFAGYHNNPEATAQATRFGWFHTGDLGHMDAAGLRVHHRPRLGHVHLRRLQRLSARDRGSAAAASRRSPKFAWLACRTLGWGESGVAVLVAAAGAEIDERALLAHLDGRLAKYKWPARFVVWPELPKSGYGKVTKRDVKQRLEQDPMMQDAPKDIAAIKDYHAHIYYDPASKERAAPLRHWVEERFPGQMRMGSWHDRTGWTACRRRCTRLRSRPICCRRLVPFLMLNRMGLTILLHPQSGRPRDDHTLNAAWMGEVLPVKTEVLREVG